MAEFEDITIGRLTFKFNKPEQTIVVEIPITGGTAILTSKKISISNNDVKVEVNGEKKFSFKINKQLTAIGSNNKNTYYKLLSANMERNGIIPDYEGDDFKEKFNQFILDMQTADGDVCEVTQSLNWQSNREEKKQSWAIISNSIEEFTPAEIVGAKEILRDGDLIEEILAITELKAVGQKDNAALVTLIALSSFLEDSIHHISTGPPGTSKSTITDTIFSIFPEQRKESIGKGSTPASLSNMTVYEEGPKVLSRKFIRLGDLGNEEEIKSASPLLSIFKELMSDKKYDKTISVPQGDTHVTQRLKIEGVGSVHLSTIEANVEIQYDSRAIISSPDNTAKTAKKIKEYQLDDLTRSFKSKEFKKKRPTIAAAIEILCQFIDKIEESHEPIQFINPYAYHINEIFDIDSSKNVNRDRNHIRDLPKSVTLANIHNRDIWVHKEDDDIKVLVTPEDYTYALKMTGKPIQQMLSNISPQTQSYIRFITENYVNNEEGNPKDLDSYVDLKIAESQLNRGAWEEKISSVVCFTKKDITSGLRVSATTVTRILDEFVDKNVIYKRLIGKKNYYFPTREFVNYSQTYSPEFLSEEELEDVYDMAVKQYENAQQKLHEAGYESYKPPSHLAFGEYNC